MTIFVSGMTILKGIKNLGRFCINFKKPMKCFNTFSFNFELKFSRKTTSSENRTTNVWKIVLLFLQSWDGGAREVITTKEEKEL